VLLQSKDIQALAQKADIITTANKLPDYYLPYSQLPCIYIFNDKGEFLGDYQYRSKMPDPRALAKLTNKLIATPGMESLEKAYLESGKEADFKPLAERVRKATSQVWRVVDAAEKVYRNEAFDADIRAKALSRAFEFAVKAANNQVINGKDNARLVNLGVDLITKEASPEKAKLIVEQINKSGFKIAFDVPAQAEMIIKRWQKSEMADEVRKAAIGELKNKVEELKKSELPKSKLDLVRHYAKLADVENMFTASEFGLKLFARFNPDGFALAKKQRAAAQKNKE